MNIHTFKLYRRIRNPKTGGVVISAFNLDRECDDPFRERMKLCREYPRWAVGSDFKSPVDQEYDATFDADVLDITYEIHDGNTLHDPASNVVYFKMGDNDDELDPRR